MNRDLKIAPTYGDIMWLNECARIGNQWAMQELAKKTIRDYQRAISGQEKAA